MKCIVLFSISHGKFIPAKHLGLAGKKEVMQILNNRFEYSNNNWLAEELETRMAEEISLTVPTSILISLHLLPLIIRRRHENALGERNLTLLAYAFKIKLQGMTSIYQ